MQKQSHTIKYLYKYSDRIFIAALIGGLFAAKTLSNKAAKLPLELRKHKIKILCFLRYFAKNLPFRILRNIIKIFIKKAANYIDCKK